MEKAVSEQSKVLFPRLQELESALQRRDEELRHKAVSSSQPEDWSPRQLPYKVYNKQVGSDVTDSSDDESESEEEESSPVDNGDGALEFEATMSLAGEQDSEELEEEMGFRYKGPEPTLYGDWAHKGRCTDF